MTKHYISITGIQIKSAFCYPKFCWYSQSAVRGARNSEGNIQTSTSSGYSPTNVTGDDCHTLFTLTVWNDRKSTMRYVTSKEHRQAAKMSTELASYIKTYHYETETIPTWDEAKQLWQENGKEYDLKNSR